MVLLRIFSYWCLLKEGGKEELGKGEEEVGNGEEDAAVSERNIIKYNNNNNLS